MIIKIRSSKEATSEQKRAILFYQALEFIHRTKKINPEKWLDGVKVGTVISYCMLNLKTKGTATSIEFNPNVDFSHLLENNEVKAREVQDKVIPKKINYSELEAEYNALGCDFEKWEWVLKNKGLDLIITFDNDNTTGWIENKENPDNGIYLEFDEYLGNGSGLSDLFDAIGVKSEFC